MYKMEYIFNNLTTNNPCYFSKFNNLICCYVPNLHKFNLNIISLDKKESYFV